MRNVTALGVVGLLSLPVAGAAQEDRLHRPPGPGPEAIIYRDAGYSGPAVAVQRPQAEMGLAWQVRSIRVNSGRWQICTGRNFSGRCTTIDRSTPLIARQYRSLRSIRPVGGTGPGLPGGGGGNSGRSLRGMAAEFFPEPMRSGQRIQCPGGASTANCAKAIADSFCRSVGWNGSRNQALQTVGRRHYIADVLCVRSGY